MLAIQLVPEATNPKINTTEPVRHTLFAIVPKQIDPYTSARELHTLSVMYQRMR